MGDSRCHVPKTELLSPPPNLTCLWHTAGYFRLGLTVQLNGPGACITDVPFMQVARSFQFMQRICARPAIIAPILEPLSLSGHTCADCANLGNNVYDA
jgi:hypothetical protein